MPEDTWAFQAEGGRVWHVHCKLCPFECLGGYTQQESAEAAAEAHRLGGVHLEVGPEW